MTAQPSALSVEDAAERVERFLTGGCTADPIPPAAELAASLRMPLSDVHCGLRLLARTGCVVTGAHGGQVIGPLLGMHEAAPAVSARVRDVSDGNPDPAFLLTDVTNSAPTHLLYGEPRITEELGTAAADHLRRQGVRESPVTLLPGGLEAIDRILSTVVEPGGGVIIENPTYSGDLPLISALGLRAVPIRVDEFGPVPGEFADACRTATACLLRPRAQNPTGAALSAARAAELRQIVAANPRLLVVEEDHAGPVAGVEYHPLIPEGHERWLHVASVSKWLGPDLRIAFVTGSLALVRRLDQRRLLGGGWVSRRLQDVVSAALRSPVVADTIARARLCYSQRRGALVDALTSQGIPATGRSGLNVWVPVPDERATVIELLHRGWLVAPGRDFGAPARQAVRVTVARLDDTDIRELATELVDVVRRQSAHT